MEIAFRNSIADMLGDHIKFKLDTLWIKHIIRNSNTEMFIFEQIKLRLDIAICLNI